MSEPVDETQPELVIPSEIETLKQRADLMQIKYHPNIGVKKLKGMIDARLSGENLEPEEVETYDENIVEEADIVTAPGKAAVPSAKQAKAMQIAQRVKEAKALVRIRLTSMNPAKTDWSGEIFTVQNRHVTLRKFVPFNAENGWHVPAMMLNFLQNKKCQVFHTVTNRAGHKVRQGKLVPEFAIEILPPLTQKELDQIATRQAAQATMDD